MKNKIILFGIFAIIFLSGMLTYRNNWFPTPQMKQLKHYFSPLELPTPKATINKIITSYTNGTPVYINRDYCDTVGDPRLEDSYIIQIPRHIKIPIEIETNRKVKIYRLLTPSNDNSIFEDWDSTNIKVGIRGKSCTYTTVISKIFTPGKITLEAGGPVAASPIIIKESSDISPNQPITILNKNINF